MKTQIGRAMALSGAIVCGVYASSASADFCLSSDVFGDEYSIGITGTSTVTGATVYTYSARRYTFNERGVYGAITSRRDGCWLSQEHHFPNGSIAIQCELPAGCLGAGPGQLTQSLDGATPVVNPITCRLATCTPPASVITEAGGIDSEE